MVQRDALMVPDLFQNCGTYHNNNRRSFTYILKRVQHCTTLAPTWSKYGPEMSLKCFPKAQTGLLALIGD